MEKKNPEIEDGEEREGLSNLKDEEVK
jgi:hypothetical protein